MSGGLPAFAEVELPEGLAHILVVDDDQNFRLVLVAFLKKVGHNCGEARDGQEAVAALETRLSDLILADIMMPRMDGWTLIKTLRSNPKTAPIPLIFLTARSQPSERVMGLQLGAEDYVCKPFEPKELEFRIVKALARSAQVQTLSQMMRMSGVELSGLLEKMSLASLLQVIDMESKSGILDVRCENRRVKMFFQQGRLKRAVLEGGEVASGVEAAMEAMRWTTGKFTFSFSLLPVKLEMDAPVPWLLMEAARRSDERQTARRHTGTRRT